MANVDHPAPPSPRDREDGTVDAPCAGPDLHESVHKLRVLRDSLSRDVQPASRWAALSAPLGWLLRHTNALDGPTRFFRPRPSLPTTLEALARSYGLAAKGIVALATLGLLGFVMWTAGPGALGTNRPAMASPTAAPDGGAAIPAIAVVPDQPGAVALASRNTELVATVHPDEFGATDTDPATPRDPFAKPDPPSMPSVGPIDATPLLEPPLGPLLGLQPHGVWLVESGDGWEQYSNGLRIETSYAVAGEPRRYRIFTESGGMSAEAFDQPVGILFHTTQSHVWPLEAAYNEHLRDSSLALIRYVGRERLYHYLIDRFGRVYRIVNDDSKANHAGNSIWRHDQRIYLNLNHAFLGVSFETRWEGDKALPITQAQLAAGRNLTAWLRQRWNIAPEMCVTHGLTSVNPRKHLIGHHMDWAQGFPFSAFELPDQYAQEAPSIAIFGFAYDDHFIQVLGQPWSGVRDAERALAGEASRQGKTVATLRRERRALYDRWTRQQAEADESSQWATASERGGD
jgi:hypothetical protein